MLVTADPHCERQAGRATAHHNSVLVMRTNSVHIIQYVHEELVVLGEVRWLAVDSDTGDGVLCVQPAVREAIDLQGKQSWRCLDVWLGMTWW